MNVLQELTRYVRDTVQFGSHLPALRSNLMFFSPLQNEDLAGSP
jgi:hypothetical protein